MTKRLRRELERLEASPLPGITIEPSADLLTWRARIEMPEGTIYAGDELVLQLAFSARYPMEAPETIFLDPVPVHEHVYGNGHICLSILYTEWSPALNVGSICISIQSMLSSATEKVRPADNASYVRRTGTRSPKQTRWDFHDESC